MSLPKINLPIFELTLPSSGEKIKYRQFTVKEEKILLVAQESNDAEQEILAAKQIVNNCLIDKDISGMAMFDLEYIMLVLRSRSVDNTISFSIKDQDTNEEVKLEVDIDNVKVTFDDNHTNVVRINEDYTLFLKYPTIDEFIKIAKLNPRDPLVSYFVMISCLDKIASNDEVYHFSDYSEQQIDEFMESMTGDVIKGIENFFNTMPKLRHEFKYKNKEGKDKTFVIEGIRSFFI